jgi:hypothetical protein
MTSKTNGWNGQVNDVITQLGDDIEVHRIERQRMRDERDYAIAEVENFRKDAARYKFLRDYRHQNWYAKTYLLMGDKFDAFIDAELAKNRE